VGYEKAVESVQVAGWCKVVKGSVCGTIIPVKAAVCVCGNVSDMGWQGVSHEMLHVVVCRTGKR